MPSPVQPFPDLFQFLFLKQSHEPKMDTLRFSMSKKNTQFETKNRYHFDTSKDQIGQGFFAKVFKGLDLKTHEVVAVKVIDKLKCPNEVFEQELKVMSQIKAAFRVGGRPTEGLALHKDILQTENKLSFIFEYFNGGDAFDEIVENGPLSEEEAKLLLRRVVPSLVQLHEAGFIHRDVKLENLLLKKSPERMQRIRSATLADFGYARKISERDEFQNPAGTFGYVAPEILLSRKYSSACDVWSLGAVLFTCVAGYQPFPHLTSEAINPSSDDAIRRELEAIQTGTLETQWRKEMSSSAFSNLSADFKHLLRQMLHPLEASRISSSEILSHSLFQGGEVEDSEEEAQEMLI